MKVSKYDLCDSCRKLHPAGHKEHTIEGLLDGEGYKKPLTVTLINSAIKGYLKEGGGCQRCISLF